MNKGTGSSTTVIRNLPSWAEDSAKIYMERSNALFKANRGSLYSGEVYAVQSQDEIDAIESIANRGRGGDVLAADGIEYANNSLNGVLLSGLDSEFVGVVSDVLDSVKVTYDNLIAPLIDGDSPYLVGGNEEHLALSLTETQVYYDSQESKLYHSNYLNERMRQDLIVPQAIGLGYQSVVDAELLRMSGLYAREYEQGSLEAEYRLWYDARLNEVRSLEILGNAVRSIVGAERTTTTPNYKPSVISTIAGGAMAGAGMGMAFGPMGMAVGAIGGIGLGAMSSQ